MKTLRLISLVLLVIVNCFLYFTLTKVREDRIYWRQSSEKWQAASKSWQEVAERFERSAKQSIETTERYQKLIKEMINQ